MKDNRFFYCYDEGLMHWLKRNNISWICRGYHWKTKNKFWQFEQSPKMQSLLHEFLQEKDENKGKIS